MNNFAIIKKKNIHKNRWHFGTLDITEYQNVLESGVAGMGEKKISDL